LNFSIIFDNWKLYLEVVILTLQLVPLSLLFGFSLALPLSVLRVSKNKVLNLPVYWFTYFFRGTPLLVQMFLFYYGLSQFSFIRDTFLWVFFKDPYKVALLSFSLNTAAYTTEIFRGAIERLPAGQIEAAKSCGMSRWIMLKRIIFPIALRNSIPAYGNEVIFMLHGSSIAGLITLVDITGAARIIYARYFSPAEAFITAAVLYLILTFTIVWVFRLLEKRFLSYLKI